MTLSSLGDSAVVLTLAGKVDEAMAARVQALAVEIGRHPPTGTVDVVPAFATIAIFYDLSRVGSYERFCAELRVIAGRADATAVSSAPRRVEIPVCYGGEFGPDLTELAVKHGMPAEAIAARHCGGDYLVHAIGFAPGFPYLGGLPPELATPRRATPRALVPGGSVGIGGSQTGIYPLATPGGWNLIGRTPLRLFDPARTPPALLAAGDRVAFRAVSETEFHALESEPTSAVRSEDELAPPGLEVLRAGMLTTVQDLGRPGHRAMGVVQGGAADAFALRVANLLVGNPEDAAGLEFTLIGPELKVVRDSLVALGGAEFEGLPRWQPVRIPAGTVLKLGHARSGCRGYLAIAGGVEVPPVLGSRGTYLRAGLGGHEGRALRDGDALSVPAVNRTVRDHWHIDERIVPPYSSHPILRFVRGAQAGEFGEPLLAGEYAVSVQSDRMGLRLAGPEQVRRSSVELLSSPVAPGTVQVPPDGRPIVLLADAQTIGGYPQIGHIISPDQPLAAQLRPGDRVRFQEIGLEAAHELALAREHALAMLREGLAQKLR